jgi:lambda family phage minor tail protein L
MKRVNDEFLREAIAQKNTPIHLVAVEVGTAYVSTITPTGTSKTTFGVTDEVQAKLTSGEVNFSVGNPQSGEIWIASFENSNNIGARKRILSIASGEAVLSEAVDWSFNANNTDKVRISKYLCLAMTNQDVNFYFPDSSNGVGVEVTYKKFPFNLTPVGTSIDGEMMSMNVDVSNVNLLVGNKVQEADGLRGNRITHITTFPQFLSEYGGSRFDCLEENMYIDSANITNDTVSFKLETRFNIMSLQIPLCIYNRNFCRWRFRSNECSWSPVVSGEVNLDAENYPMASSNSCDHSLKGPNGCLAHNNTVRFGGFPSISAR